MAMGRPRAFCVDEALNRALEVFWRKGYEGASLTDLTDAMGINRPSLYAAFGNKEALFRKALDRYIKEKVSYLHHAISQPTARGMAENILLGAARMLTDPCHPVGCLTVKGAMTCGDEAPSVKREIEHVRNSFETGICAKIEGGKASGELPPDTDTVLLCRYLTTMVQGMAVQAANGASCEDLCRVAEMAMAVWPTAASQPRRVAS